MRDEPNAPAQEKNEKRRKLSRKNGSDHRRGGNAPDTQGTDAQPLDESRHPKPLKSVGEKEDSNARPLEEADRPNAVKPVRGSPEVAPAPAIDAPPAPTADALPAPTADAPPAPAADVPSAPAAAAPLDAPSAPMPDSSSVPAPEAADAPTAPAPVEDQGPPPASELPSDEQQNSSESPETTEQHQGPVKKAVHAKSHAKSHGKEAQGKEKPLEPWQWFYFLVFFPLAVAAIALGMSVFVSPVD